jgi:hypothetical protein
MNDNATLQIILTAIEYDIFYEKTRLGPLARETSHS